MNTRDGLKFMRLIARRQNSYDFKNYFARFGVPELIRCDQGF